VDYLEVIPTNEPQHPPFTDAYSWTYTCWCASDGETGQRLVAVKVNNGVFLSWRMFGTDPSNIAFNLYRNGTKINSTPITGATNYVDTGGTTSSTYTVRAVINGQEQEASNL